MWKYNEHVCLCVAISFKAKLDKVCMEMQWRFVSCPNSVSCAKVHRRWRESEKNLNKQDRRGKKVEKNDKWCSSTLKQVDLCFSFAIYTKWNQMFENLHFSHYLSFFLKLFTHQDIFWQVGSWVYISYWWMWKDNYFSLNIINEKE